MGKVQLVFAVGLSEDGAFPFGNDQGLPWGHCKQDLQNFKRITEDTILLMGRYTFNSLPKKLPGRMHVVLSSTAARIATKMEEQRPDMQINGGSLSVALDVLKSTYPDKTISVIGGKGMIEEMLRDKLADEIHVTFMTPLSGKPFPYDVDIDGVLLGTNYIEKCGYYRKETHHEDMWLWDHPSIKSFNYEQWNKK